MLKNLLICEIIDQLTKDQKAFYHAAKKAHQDATNKENVPDNKYDTLSLELSYLAQGQANRAQEIKSSLEQYQNLNPRSFNQSDPIALTALTTLIDEDGQTKKIFIGPCGGGIKVKLQEDVITVITPFAPLGKLLMGKQEGDEFEFKQGVYHKSYEILSVD